MKVIIVLIVGLVWFVASRHFFASRAYSRWVKAGADFRRLEEYADRGSWWAAFIVVGGVLVICTLGALWMQP
jgi:hypothetical protein